jgi:polyribonucleotide nucleotidyltransferase
VDGNGKIRLSRQAVLEGWTVEEAQERDRPSKPRSGGGDRGNSRGRSGGDRGGNRSPRRN